MKSNPLSEILSTLSEVGCGFEIASTGELDKLLFLDVDPSRIIYSNPVKSRDSIAYAFGNGVGSFSFDSEQELQKLAEHAPGANVYMRVAVSESGSRFSMSEKFGVLLSQATDLALKVANFELNLVGLAFHVGSQAENSGQWQAAIAEVGEVIRELESEGIKLDFLNIGGGFPESYLEGQTPRLSDIATEVHAAIQQLPYTLRLYMEPGRRMVANSATLTTKVIARLERNKENWLFLDTSAYNSVFEAMIFQGNMRYNIDPPNNRTGVPTNFVLTGPTCDSLDTISYNAQLPGDIQEGDSLVIKNVGAYSLTFASEFNGFEIPKAYFINRD